jgi:hypothetical protein
MEDCALTLCTRKAEAPSRPDQRCTAPKNRIFLEAMAEASGRKPRLL